MKGWENFTYIINWFLNIVFLNVLWIVFTLLGGVVFGLFPATSAMFAIVRKWMILKEGESNIVVSFWEYYKKDFLKLNIFSLIFYIFGYVLYLNAMYLLVNASHYYFLIPGLLILFIVYILTILFFFPVFVHYKLSFFQYMKQSFLIAFVSPLEILGVLLILLFSILLITWIPGALLFFTGSGFAISITYLAHGAFVRLDKKRDNT